MGDVTDWSTYEQGVGTFTLRLTPEGAVNVPAPQTAGLLLTGLALVVASRRRKAGPC
ncbi:MAG: PEP-CTERM sorting domain-containing protein [Thiohalorhabdus sp.]|uniref:PEP-CTERM sorting domain-containing protein n=1 Tax=Thiohalorhabdus sp. TaxID=3094134 RepID=UPI0039819298